MNLQHLLIALVVRDAHDFVPKLLFRAMGNALEQRVELFVARVLDERPDIFDPVEHEAHMTGQRAVAAAFAFRRFFHDSDARAFFQRSVSS